MSYGPGGWLRGSPLRSAGQSAAFERRGVSLAARVEPRAARLALSEVWHADSTARQHSGLRLAEAGRRMPSLRSKNCRAISVRRVCHGAGLSRRGLVRAAGRRSESAAADCLGIADANLGIVGYHPLLVAGLMCATLLEFDGHKLPWKVVMLIFAVGLIAPLWATWLHPQPADASLAADARRFWMLGLVDSAAGGMVVYVAGCLASPASDIGPAGRRGASDRHRDARLDRSVSGLASRCCVPPVERGDCVFAVGRLSAVVGRISPAAVCRLCAGSGRSLDSALACHHNQRSPTGRGRQRLDARLLRSLHPRVIVDGMALWPPSGRLTPD